MSDDQLVLGLGAWTQAFEERAPSLQGASASKRSTKPPPTSSRRGPSARSWCLDVLRGNDVETAGLLVHEVRPVRAFRTQLALAQST